MKTIVQRCAIRQLSLVACSLLIAASVLGSEQPTVHVEPTDAVGPRTLEKQTETGVIRDYLQAWRTLSNAFDQNRSDLLDQYFVGAAKDKLTDAIRDRAKVGIQTRYSDKAHDLQLVFYSPEGLSIQLMDTVDYDVQVLDHVTAP